MKKTASSSFKKNEDTRIWCEYCRIFVYNNRINREKHDSSPQHQANFKKKVEMLRKEEEQASKLLKNELTSVKFERSFYQTASTSTNSISNSDIQPTNILSLKSTTGKTVEKKAVLGLNKATVSKDSQVISSRPIDEDSDSSPIHKTNLDLKTVSHDLKRKAKDDEKLLFEQKQPAEYETHDDSATTLESLNVFKKKKTK